MRRTIPADELGHIVTSSLLNDLFKPRRQQPVIRPIDPVFVLPRQLPHTINVERTELTYDCGA